MQQQLVNLKEQYEKSPQTTQTKRAYFEGLCKTGYPPMENLVGLFVAAYLREKIPELKDQIPEDRVTMSSQSYEIWIYYRTEFDLAVDLPLLKGEIRLLRDQIPTLPRLLRGPVGDALKRLEKKVVGEEVPSAQFDFDFEHLIEMKPEQLMNVDPLAFQRLPLEQLKKFSVEQLMSLPVEALDGRENEELVQFPPELIQNLKRELELDQPLDISYIKQVDISQMHPLDIDVINMDINKHMRYKVRLARRVALLTQKLTAEQRAKIKDQSQTLQKEADEIVQLKNNFEAKVKDRGLTPLPDRLEPLVD